MFSMIIHGRLDTLRESFRRGQLISDFQLLEIVTDTFVGWASEEAGLTTLRIQGRELLIVC